MRSLLRGLSCLGLYVGLLATGCASQQADTGAWEGPAARSQTTVHEWTFGEDKARLLQSRHYRLYTTIEDEEVLDALPQVMEGAMCMYRQIVPGAEVSDQPLDCYIFRLRSEWDRYTQRYAGSDARIYLQIRSGGYTVRDKYVAYFIGRASTFSVAAHEGWHQFAGRHFKGRMPPFLEEGLACMFETITWQEGLPRWNLSLNTMRAQHLRKAIETKDLYPLEQLCSMHAGDIVGESSDKIDTFYAQSWAFARFLWEAERGRYRQAMQKWLGETASGTVYDPSRSHSRATSLWNRRAVRPMMEHYLGMDIKAIEVAFTTYMHQVAREEGDGWRP